MEELEGQAEHLVRMEPEKQGEIEAKKSEVSLLLRGTKGGV